MNADAASLEALGKVLLKRASDLSYLGRKLSSETWGIEWECAKADRYSAAMTAREMEIRKLANQMRELGNYLRMRAYQMGFVEDQAPRPEEEEETTRRPRRDR
jgi:hypothetical protein